MSVIGETFGQLFGGSNVHRLLSEKADEQQAGAVEFAGRDGQKLAPGGDMSEAEGFALLAIHEPTELQIIGEQKVWE